VVEEFLKIRKINYKLRTNQRNYFNCGNICVRDIYEITVECVTLD